MRSLPLRSLQLRQQASKSRGISSKMRRRSDIMAKANAERWILRSLSRTED